MKPVSILVDPSINVDDVRIALRHSSLELVGSELHPTVFVIKPTPSSPSDDTVRVPVLRQAGYTT
jgi:hypothetical protein